MISVYFSSLHFSNSISALFNLFAVCLKFSTELLYNTVVVMEGNVILLQR